MTQFAVNPNRHDPYKQFKFRVTWDGRVVAGVTKVGALRRSTEVIEHREGGDPSTSRKSPGRTQFQPVVLARGLTHDTEFENWANKGMAAWSRNLAGGFSKGHLDPADQRGRPDCDCP